MPLGEGIVAWLRLRDTARFRRDARKAEEAIKGIGDAADDAGGPLHQLGGAMTEMLSNLPKLNRRTRLFGFAIGTVLTFFVSLIPLVVAFGGAITALVGSLGAAAVGAGLLATAVAGAMLPLGGFALVASQAKNDFEKVATAWEAYNVQVGAFGKNSKQAETALAHLHGIVKQHGGAIMFRAVRMWSNFTSTFREMNQPAVRTAMQFFIELMKTGRQLMPAFAKMVNSVAKELSKNLLPVLHTLGDGKGTFGTLTKAFKALAGPSIRAIVNFFAGLLNIAKRLAPLVGPLAGGIEDISVKFRAWTAFGDLMPFIQSLRDWWGLLKAVGRLLFNILKGGKSEGDNLVVSLTKVVNKWADWLNTVKGTNSLKKFFKDAVQTTVEFFKILAGVTKAIFQFGRALMPIYTKVMKALRAAWADFMDAIRPAQPFFKNVLGPLLKGIATGVIAGLVGSFKLLMGVTKLLATALGWLGDKLSFLKGPIEVVGKVLGFVFGGAILKALSLLGKLSPILGPIGTAFRVLSWPIRTAGRLVGFLLGKFGKLAGWIGSKAATIFSPFRRAINAILDFFADIGSKFYDAGAKIWNFMKNGLMNAIGSGLSFAADLGKAVANAVITLLNKAIPNKIPVPVGPDINLPDNPIPKLASGGVVSGSGSWITGEAGPEVNTLRGGRVVVQPLTPAVSATMGATLDAGDGKRILVSKIYLKGKQIAEAVADEAEDERARQ